MHCAVSAGNLPSISTVAVIGEVEQVSGVRHESVNSS